MPLERVVVRSAHALGAPELYKGGTNREDPKAVFDGVAVAGLVGILRNLGDLAEFAAEVFHGLQEEVVTTATRSGKLVNRVKQIESVLPNLEKAALAQTSHLHFHYTAGTDWHVHIQNQRNHLIHGELPKFIMDSYEECREPPRLHLLDKFDSNGPGSCLKKYSDPTFFKKATPVPDEAVDKAEKDKRHRRRKKKRQAQKNRELHSLSISNGIARMQLVPPIIPVSPAHSISMNEAALKSESVDQPQSFNLTSGSDFIECVFDCSSLGKAEEEPKEPQFMLQPYENFNSDFSEHHDNGEENNSHRKSSLLDEPSTSSTHVSWEEKMEILNFKDYGCVADEDPKTLVYDSCIDDATAANHCQADQIFSSDAIQTENVTSVPDDLESDSEDFMDALNTIESESDIDSEYQAKQVVDHNTSGLSFPEICEEPNHGPSTFNSAHVLMSPSEVPSDRPDTVSFNSHMHAESPQLAEGCNINSSVTFLNYSQSDTLHNDPSPSIVLTSHDLDNSRFEKIMNGIHDSRESPLEYSARSSVTFWTNGGLLGLQPSKPPDFTASSGSSGSSTVTRKDGALISSAEKGPNKSACNDELNIVAKGSPTKTCTQHNASGFMHQERDNSPQMSGHAFRLFSNSFQRKLPSIHDYGSLPVGSPEHDCSERQTVTQKSFLERFPKRLLTGGFDINSPNCSPPLEHMKISFLPMGALEASNLKLKFQDEGSNQEVYGDMLPSFQLVPDPFVPPRENCSDSDDDTFCRSPPSKSDEWFDYHSESSSGRWESSETPRSNGQELYDDLHIMQSAECTSGYGDLDTAFHEHSDSDNVTGQNNENVDHQCLTPSNELPSFNVIKSSVLQQTKLAADLKESHPLVQFPNEPIPPPPLPPSQWICSKPPSGMTNSPQEILSAGPGHGQGFKFTGFSSFQEQQNLLSTWQPKFLEIPTTNQHKEEETTVLPPTDKLLDQQKVFGKAKANQAVNEIEDKDDFLQQIKAQSFNLRRTSLISSTRSNSMPSAPITNAKVTAILEKANAIRQVVASDDGEDDTWSE